MRLRRPRYADVAATIALLFAMSGTAYAVAKLPANSVDTAAIQDAAVTTPKIKANAVKSGNILNGSLLEADYADGSVTNPKIADSSVTGAKIQDGSVGNADLGVDSVQAIQIADNTIDSGEIINNSLFGTDIADGSIANVDLADSSVDSSKVANNSLTTADLAGIDINGSISISLGANACATLTFGVSGALVGQAVIMSYTGTVTLPNSFVFTPFRVSAKNTVIAGVCNVSSTSKSVSSIGVRFVTFG